MVQIPKDSIPQIYTFFMEEIKLRVEHGREWLSVVAEHRDEPAAFLYVEFSYLQVRRVTELMALAVLAAHNLVEDFRTNKFLGEWNPDALFATLARLNDKGFPAAINVIPGKEGKPESPGTAEVVISKKGYLDKAGFAKIYHGCCDKLHAGSLKHLVQQGGRKRYDLGDIAEWFNQIVKLLDHHIVRLPEMKACLLVAMASEPDGNVSCVMSEMVGEGPLHLVPPKPPPP